MERGNKRISELAPELPSWLCASEEYVPAKDRDGFLTKSTLGLVGVLSRFRLQNGVEGRFEPAPLFKLLALVIVILLVSLSANFIFTACVLALVLVRLCVLPDEALKETVVVAVLAALLSMLIMLPAVFIGQAHSFILISVKVFISVSLALVVSTATPFNQITASLRALHVPNLFVLTIDLTLKYIVMLGDIALEVLTALRCRSVGKNTSKAASLGGVIGTTFIKSQELSLETYSAMRCRGFSGEYTASRSRMKQCGSVVATVVSALGLLALIAFFFVMEGIVPW